MLSSWRFNSWKEAKLKLQIPAYDNLIELEKTKNKLKKLDNLVDLNEITELRKKLKLVNERKAFIIIAGDCAESIKFSRNNVIKTVNIINEISDSFINYFSNLRKSDIEIVKIGRIAGQYAKPRSNDFETRNGISLPVYRGDIINSIEFTEESRKTKPKLMEKAFKNSQKTIKLIKKINSTLNLNKNSFYTAHEALLLDYEESLLRKQNNITFLSSTHFPWIGNRTRNADSAHVEFLRGIVNPISIKCDSNIDLEDLVKIIKTLNPLNEDDKICLTVRMGVKKIEKFFPKLIERIKLEKLNVIWTSDPMHGNRKDIDGIKTRYLKDIENEALSFIRICKDNNIFFGGIHLELTAVDVTECIGLSVNESNLKSNYLSLCDPRLNREQSLYLVSVILNNFQLTSLFLTLTFDIFKNNA